VCNQFVLNPSGANADGDPAADGIRSETVGRCNKSAQEGESPNVQFKE